MNRQRVTLPIEDFGCSGSGALIVERAIARVPGVLRVYVNAATEMAYVQYDDSHCGVSDLVQAVEQAGFHAGAPIPA